jgi:hypothetical protein
MMKKKGLTKQLLAISMVFLFASDLAESAEIRQEARSFAPFWAQFKAAVANNNKEAIAAMTKFPFDYYGKQLTKADFIKQYDAIFSHKVQRCFRNAKPVKHADRESYSVFCGTTIFGFEKGNVGYQFTDMGEND